MGKAFTELEKLEIKEQIIASAMAQFKEQPYKEVKIDNIAKSVGIGKGTVYLFYPSKEHIFIEVMMQFEQLLQNRIQDEVRAVLDAKARIRESIRIGLEETDDNQIYNALSDKTIMDKIFKLLNPEQLQTMESADVVLLKSLLRETPLKVEISVAIDLMRGVFFMRLFKAQLISNYDVFIENYVDAILEKML